MALWRANLRISWRTQLFSLLIHGALTLLILLSPWPAGYGSLWILLLTLMIYEFIRSQKRISARRGELCLHREKRVSWHQREWLLDKRPWMLNSGIMLYLREVKGKLRQRLWIAADSMSQEEWRTLRQLLLQQRFRDEPDEKIK